MFGGLPVHTKDVVKCEILNILNIPNLEEVMANYFLTLWILEILQYLNKLEVEEFEDIKSGYRIKLYFDKNPYFDNDILTKEFHLGSSGDPASQSTPIQWKESMDLAAKFAQRTAAAQENAAKSGSRKRGHQQQATFFTWFCDNGDPSDDEIAEVIKDDMW